MGINSRFECPHSGQVIVEYSSIARNREDFPKNVTDRNGSLATLEHRIPERPILGGGKAVITEQLSRAACSRPGGTDRRYGCGYGLKRYSVKNQYESNRQKNSPDEGAIYPLYFKGLLGAGNQIRTGDLNLGKVALYQLSYSREGARF